MARADKSPPWDDEKSNKEAGTENDAAKWEEFGGYIRCVRKWRRLEFRDGAHRGTGA